MTELDLESEIADLCEHYALKWHACGDSIRCRGQRGQPDLLIAGPGGILHRELKTGGGKLTTDQVAWSWTLRAGGADWAVWRPIHLESGQIEAELREIAARPAA